jgi:arsenate reductase
MPNVQTVLFLCTGNSARSIMAEVLLNRLGQGRFKAYSAGSRPTSVVNPITVQLLEGKGFDVRDLRSKSWDEFANGPNMDFVITVCDNAAREECPIWPGHPMSAHWGFDDPAAAATADRLRAFKRVFEEISRRIRRLVEFDRIDAESLREIGES